MASSPQGGGIAAALHELSMLIDGLPPANRPALREAHSRLAGAVCEQLDQVMTAHRQVLALARDTMAGLYQLRADGTYILFDLEATRRERDDLQRRLEVGDDGQA